MTPTPFEQSIDIIHSRGLNNFRDSFFFVPPDTIWRSPKDNRRIVMASPTEQIEVELSTSLTGRHVACLQDHYEQQGELGKIRLGHWHALQRNA